ncbi:MAG: hypothetical protein KAI83_17410 [Thiomargarita sp.]|nr:hypothetical protein [Thiomargarita sp.]
MDSKIKLQIENYLSDEDKLYQDWYTGLFEASEDASYTTEVGVIPNRDELKRLFEKWFKKQKEVLKNLCDGYCQKRQQQEQQPFLIAAVADGLVTVTGGIPLNVAAVATILVAGKFLDRLCDCSKNEESFVK